MSLVPPSSPPRARPSEDGSPALQFDDFDSTEALTVDVRADGNHHVVTVKGELDLATAPQLSDVLRSQLDVVRHVVIDLDQVGFIDSTGLSVLVATHRRMTEQGGWMVLVCNNPRCMRVLDITGLSRVFDFCASTADAALRAEA